MFSNRATRLERIDTGDYTPEEYAKFLREIAFINRCLGDSRAIRKSLLREIEREDLREFSVLDVACGSGELLKKIATFSRWEGRTATLTGIDSNPLSAAATHTLSHDLPEINAIRGDAFSLPFADASFDYAVSSLFFHHLTDSKIPDVLSEMSRVARRGIFVIDLHRKPMAYFLYKLFCVVFRISPLVRQDGSLSILRGFSVKEIRESFAAPGITVERIERVAPYRIVFCGRVCSTTTD